MNFLPILDCKIFRLEYSQSSYFRINIKVFITFNLFFIINELCWKHQSSSGKSIKYPPIGSLLFVSDTNLPGNKLRRLHSRTKKKKDGPALEAGMIAKRPAKIPFHSCRKRFIHNVLTPNRCTQAISQVTFDYHLSLEKRQRLKPNLRVFKLVKCSKSLCPAICQWCKLMDLASTSTTANRISQANPFIKWCPSIAAGRLPNRNQYKYFGFRA